MSGNKDTAPVPMSTALADPPMGNATRSIPIGQAPEDLIASSAPVFPRGLFNPQDLTNPGGIPASLPRNTFSWSTALGVGRRSSNMSPGEYCAVNTLEMEAVAAVHELRMFVKDIYVSDLLPRAADIIFINVTTLEGQAYCFELTPRGWRVTSMRHDCMNGDVDHLELHTRYFETVYALMNVVSPAYQKGFSEVLAWRLNQLSGGAAAKRFPPGVTRGEEEEEEDVLG